MMTTSQLITVRHQLSKAADELSEAVDEWRKRPTTANSEAVCRKHDAYKAAQAELWK